MHRKFINTILAMCILAMLMACDVTGDEINIEDAVKIELTNEDIKVNGEAAGTDNTTAVYVANDIVYYEDGHDFIYGEGSEDDAHSQEDALAHTVVHITHPGVYSVSGQIDKGQIAIDLGEDAKDNPEAVVTLILNGVDITCEVAPAVIFSNVYECGSKDEDEASKEADTSMAGANVIIADGTTNTVNGSYVARIYEPDSVELSEDGTEVKEADKLHKYDGAFYSRRSMNVYGGKKNTGVLNINAENEGLNSELHLTINGGIININSGNDGINTNEDNVSVTTINGGCLTIKVNGSTGEGDGIDSNGWLVINGGTVTAAACATSADAGIDSDMGIHINGGTVMATGHMLDHIEEGGQNYAVFNFRQAQDGNGIIHLKNDASENVMELLPDNAYSVLVYSSPDLKTGTYTLWSDDTQLAGQSGEAMLGGPGGGGMMPGGMPQGGEALEGLEPGEMNPPDMLQGFERPDGMEQPMWGERPEGGGPSGGPQPPMNLPNQFNGSESAELSIEFIISQGANTFGNVSVAE